MEEKLLNKLKNFYEEKHHITEMNLTIQEEDLLRKICNKPVMSELEKEIWKYVNLITGLK